MTRAASEAGLVRALGVWGLAASVVNITIGGGIFRAPGATEVTGRLGAAAPLAYLVCAVAMAFVVLCFSEAGSRVASTGGPYAYVERAFGGFAGFVVGWMLWITGTIATAAVGTIFADSVARMVPALGSGVARGALMTTMFLIVAAINVRGVQFGARLNLTSAVIKLLPLALLIVLGLANISADNMAWKATPGAGDLTRASVFLIFIFAGIECAMVPSGEVREPARTVPRAVLMALGIVTLVYVSIHIAAQGVLGDKLAGNSAPLADLASAVMGPAGGVMMGIAVVLSTFGYLCGMVLAMPRALFAFSRDGILPGAIAAVHPRFHTPWVAIVLQAGLSLILGLSSGFEPLVVLANVCVLLVYLGCAAAAWQLRRAGVQEDTALKSIPGSGAAPFLAVIVIVILLSSVTRQEWLVAGAALGVGLLIWALSRMRNRGSTAAERVPAP